MEVSNFFQQSSEARTKAEEKLKTVLQKYFIVIVLLFNIALQIVSRLYRFGLQNAFTPEFFISFFINTTTSMLAYVTFIPIGKYDELNRSSTFQSLVDEWEKLTKDIREKCAKQFELFCQHRVNEERQETRHYILANNTLISFDTYKQSYEGLDKQELKALYKEGKINRDEYLALRKCIKVKIKPINPLVVLQGAKKTKVNDAGREGGSYSLNKVLLRVVVLFIFSFVFNTISTTYKGATADVILDILLSIFSLIVSSVMGYSTGVNDFKFNEDRIKARVLFISLFKKSEFYHEDKQDIRGTRVCSNLQNAELQPQEDTNSGKVLCGEVGN